MEERKNRRATLRTLCTTSAVVLLMLFLPLQTRAQGRGSRALRSIKTQSTANGWELDLQLDSPARYLRHTPTGSGKVLRILVDPLRSGVQAIPSIPLRQVLPLSGKRKVPIVEVAYDATSVRAPFIEIQFSRPMVFQVEQGEGLQSIKIQIREVTKPQAGPSDKEHGRDESKSGQLLARAKQAIRDGEPDLAISLLTKILETEANAMTPETRQQAQELVGLTHERRGQTAHARAEYEAYLESYPDGPAAQRVRQRLEALLTAGSAPRPALRTPTNKAQAARRMSSERPLEVDVFGSLAVTYFRFEGLLDEGGDDFLASNLLTDVDLVGRIDADDWVVRTDLIGTYDTNIDGKGGTDDFRVSQLSVEYENRNRGIELILGRQGRSDSGVLGRFDGVYGAYRLGSHFSISALAGLPVESVSDSKPNTDSILAGGAINVEDFWIEGLRGQLFVIGQNTESMMDRTAIGGEIRYSNAASYSFIYFDYDMLFDSLNTAIVSTTYYWTPETDFRLLVERRNSPILTLASALQGRTEQNLNDLKETFSDSEIRDLASDRVLSFWTGTLGATHRPNDLIQISGDFTVSYSSDTDTSDDGLVPGVESTGPNFSGSLQYMVNDWLIERGVGSISARYFEGDSSRSFGVAGFSRFLLFEGFRFGPRLRWDWRDSDLQGESSALRPSIETEWRYKSFLLNADVGIQWLEPLPGSELQRDTTYFVELGVRWEF